MYDCCRKSSTCTEHVKEHSNAETCNAHNDTHKLTVFLHVPSYVTVKLLWCIEHSNPCLNHSHIFCMSLLNAVL